MSDRFPEPRMRDEFRSELRAKLILEAQTVLDPRRRRDNAWRSLFGRSLFRPALGVGVAALVLIAGAGTAAAGSVPGDPAFVLKKAVEDLQVTFTFDDVQRVQLLAQLTDRRLDELQKVANSSNNEDKSPTASEEYAAAVTRFRAAVDALQQAAPQEKADAAQDVADAARDKHDAVLDAIEQKVPDQAKPALERAKEEEHKDKGDKDKGKGNAKDTPNLNGPATAEPTRSPRPTETTRASEAPRRTDAPSARPATPRPSTSSRD